MVAEPSSCPICPFYREWVAGGLRIPYREAPMSPRTKPSKFRFQPRVSELEDRSVPATLDLTGTTLTFTLDPGATASMSGNDLALTFDAGAGNTITVTGAAGNGFV